MHVDVETLTHVMKAMGFLEYAYGEDTLIFWLPGTLTYPTLSPVAGTVSMENIASTLYSHKVDIRRFMEELEATRPDSDFSAMWEWLGEIADTEEGTPNPS